MNADRVVFRARVILSTTLRRRSSMVIWIVFTAVDSDVDPNTHHIPHPAAAVSGPIPVGGFCGNRSCSVGLRGACCNGTPLGKLLNFIVISSQVANLTSASRVA